MRWRPMVVTALGALACAWGAACGGGGGSDSIVIITRSPFPQGFLPVLLTGSGGSADVAFRVEGDLFAVAGTAELRVISRLDGSDATHPLTGARPLLSITPGDDGRLFAGDNLGGIWAISGNGSALTPFAATPLVTSADTGTTQSITGLAFAPSGFGDFGGQLFAAAGTAGLLRVTTTDPPQAVPFTNPPGNYVDLAFSGTTLFAIDATNKEIDTVSPDGTAASFRTGFNTPVGMTVDSTASEIYVADAGDDVLYTVPVAGGARTPRAAYSFASAAPSGLAFDSLGAIAFITADPPAIRGSSLPRIDPANANFGRLFIGPTVGYGDLELDRAGAFVIAANDVDDPPAGDSINNFLFSLSRDASSASTLASGVGSPLEELLGAAVDPKQEVIYFSTRRGNVYRRTSDGTVTLLVSATSSAILGLEIAPAGFTGFAGDLIATTGDGQIIPIDPVAQTAATPIAQGLSHLVDLVFSAGGTLYVVENNESTSRILRVAPNGAVTDLAVPVVQLGRADGIEIDEGGNRLLVASETAGGGQLLSVDLRPAHLGEVRALANFTIDVGFFPTGVVYDRLGTAVVRQGNNSTSLHAAPVPLPVP